MTSIDVPKPPVSPVRWTPPPNPGLRGDYERNERLADAELWPLPDHGPEDVVLTADGTLYTGTADGSILRVADEGDRIERIATTGGRPLGIELLDDGRLLVCDAYRGLLAVDPGSGATEVLVEQVDGQPLRCTNNAAVAPDGTIWFTDSSRRFTLQHYKGDLLEHTSTGRLLRRDPDGTVETVLDGLQFANGVALDPAGKFLLVAETGSYLIQRLWLTGDRQGTAAAFAELPGFPDNLSTGPTGTFWCAIASVRNVLLDLLLPRPPLLRKVVWRMPDRLQPEPAGIAMVVGFDATGAVTHNLQWHGGQFKVATGAREHDGHLYIGSLTTPAVLRYRL